MRRAKDATPTLTITTLAGDEVFLHRGWCARECARRVKQKGFRHSVNQSKRLEARSKLFRTAKEFRRLGREKKLAAELAARAAR